MPKYAFVVVCRKLAQKGHYEPQQKETMVVRDIYIRIKYVYINVYMYKHTQERERDVCS